MEALFKVVAAVVVLKSTAESGGLSFFAREAAYTDGGGVKLMRALRILALASAGFKVNSEPKTMCWTTGNFARTYNKKSGFFK